MLLRAITGPLETFQRFPTSHFSFAYFSNARQRSESRQDQKATTRSFCELRSRRCRVSHSNVTLLLLHLIPNERKKNEEKKSWMASFFLKPIYSIKERSVFFFASRVFTSSSFFLHHLPKLYGEHLSNFLRDGVLLQLLNITAVRSLQGRRDHSHKRPGKWFMMLFQRSFAVLLRNFQRFPKIKQTS